MTLRREVRPRCALSLGCRTLAISLLFGAGLAAGASLYPFSVDQDHLSGIVDFSDLGNGAIHKQDRLVVCGARLCKAGGSAGASAESAVRLFGVTLAHDAVFPSDEQADMLVSRLRRLGVNLVRLHGFDTVAGFEPAEAQSILLDGPFPTLNPESLRRLKHFLVKLRDAGIYVDLNLHVNYRFRPAIDEVPAAFPGDDFMPEESKPLYIFDDRLTALQVAYVRRLLSALGTSATNVVAIVEISNESSLVYDWASDRLSRDVKGYYRAELAAKWAAFQGKSGSAASAGDYLPGRTDSVPDELKDRFVTFLTELDKTYLERMRVAIRSANPDLLVVGTQMAYGGFQNLKSNASMDIADSHVYVDHYGFLGKFADWNTWYIRDVSGFDGGLAELRDVAFYRPIAKPYIVSEYNQPWPNRQAAEIIPVAAGLASLQDWSAIVFYDYSETRDDWDARTPREYTLDTDYTKLPTVGPMAWLYRTFEVNPATAPMEVRMTDDASLAAIRAGVTDQSANFVARSLAIDTRGAFSKRVGVSLGSAEAHPPLTGESPARTKNMGVSFPVGEKQMLFNTRSVVGVVGRVKPGVEQAFGRVKLNLAPGSRNFVTFIAMSRDGAPVEQSRHMLWIIPGYTLGSKPGVSPPAPAYLQAAEIGLPRRIMDVIKWNGSPNRVRFANAPRPSGYGVLAAHAPIWMERVECVVTLPHAFSNVKVYPLDGRGQRLAPLSEQDAHLRDGALSVHLQGDGQALAPWYELIFS
jgi:hypothetical protein